MKKLIIFVLSFLFCRISFAQGAAAIPSLNFVQSAFLNGAGQIGAAIPVHDALGFYFNPAQLGYFAADNNLSINLMPEKSNYNGNFFPMTSQSFGIAAGYNFNRINKNLPLSVGIGYIRNKFDYGNYTYGTKTINSYDSFDCLSVGAGYKYYLLFNVGFSAKFYNSVMGAFTNVNELSSVKADGTAFDLGAMIIAPLSNLFFNDAAIDMGNESFLKPVLNFTLGYSLTNLGKKVSYIDPAQADPLPRTARLGYSINTGVNLNINNYGFKALDYSFTAEAQDMLITNSNGSVQYQGILGDIKIGTNLIGLKGDRNVILHRGHILKVFETVILTSGRLGYGNYSYKTSGVGFSSEGVLKLLGILTNNRTVKYIAHHIGIEYYNSNSFLDLPNETNYKGLNVYLRNFEL